ncbi:MAG: hypothetical protein IJA98_10640 [Bacteroidaceae bacterium]|nr:hypothetical protein [Bacteroidaceae bacterium]
MRWAGPRMMLYAPLAIPQAFLETLKTARDVYKKCTNKCKSFWLNYYGTQRIMPTKVYICFLR